MKQQEKQQEKQQQDQENQQRAQLNGVIQQHVMRSLGRPGDLLGVQVRHLWDDRYRVNVLVGGDATSAKVAHSYFLMADSNGNILASTPLIAKQYASAGEGR